MMPFDMPDVSPSTPLADLFRKQVRAGLKMPEDDAELERLLIESYGVARASWPAIALSRDTFIAHLAKQLPAARGHEPPAIEQGLQRIHLSDLYLACACSDGSRAAQDALERVYLAKLPGLLSWHHVPFASIEDVCQKLRMKLLMPSTRTGKPHISTYRGDGELISWMKVIATRIANKERVKGKVDQVASSILGELGGKENQEKDVVKQDLREKVSQAVKEAVGLATSKEQRQLLRLYYADGLSTPEIAKLRGMTQVMVWRRLDAAREAIHEKTKELLKEHHGWTANDLKGFVGDIQSRLDISLSQIFAPKDSSRSGSLSYRTRL